jgi:hypothetical protein
MRPFWTPSGRSEDNIEMDYFNISTVFLLLFCTMINKCTINWQIITIPYMFRHYCVSLMDFNSIKPMWSNFKIVSFNLCYQRLHLTYLCKFNIHGSVQRNNIILYKSQQDAHVTEFILSDNCSTCFGRHYHPSSGAQTNVTTAFGNRYTVFLSAAIVEVLEFPSWKCCWSWSGRPVGPTTTNSTAIT